jgi:hypothetical protein
MREGQRLAIMWGYAGFSRVCKSSSNLRAPERLPLAQFSERKCQKARLAVAKSIAMRPSDMRASDHSQTFISGAF